MTSTAVYHQLAKHQFLAGLSPAWLRELASYGEQVQCPRGLRLFDVGDPADAFWLIQEGVVALDLPGPGTGRVRLDWLGRDSLVGWSWLVSPYRFSVGAVVAEPMRVVEIRASGARRLLQQDPSVRGEFLTRCLEALGGRLAAVRRQQALAGPWGHYRTKVPLAPVFRP